ncbi:arsenate reductase (glutaredoxin) [Corynebacterium breve]|uniref:arsenate reductase (glutathione/glutaredoxin) n=1 Tax=Corynebacterium breve TaxID=3049799 RepID=A0ABY8VFY4_9CORY|nr:arsenate reductase (glutaredoxin) [Corynebacterium breve]WIM68550.1 arsenate reductase (glutaredoxin) [Corynebacterium breve]
MSTIYHNPQCSTSRNALKMLHEHGEEPTVVKYLETPPSKSELKQLINDAGLSVHDAIRTREAEYKELGLSKDLTDDELLDAMVAHPRLIQRPIVVTDKGVRIPRPMELLSEIL